jgi:ankyrin repeat protein
MNNSVVLFLILLSGWTCSAQHSPRGHAAARSGDLDGLRKVYTDGGTNVNLVEPGTGQTPLMAAVLSGATASVKVLLLELSADPTIPEKDGYTPPHGAGFQGRADVAQLLIERHRLSNDCPIDAPHEGDHLTPLWRTTWGREQRHLDAAEVMLKGGADPNYRVPDKWADEAATPLQAAVVRSNLNSVQLLLAYNGDPVVQNHAGDTALHVSLRHLMEGQTVQRSILKALMQKVTDDNNQHRMLKTKNANDITVIDMVHQIWQGESKTLVELLHLLTGEGDDGGEL